MLAPCAHRPPMSRGRLTTSAYERQVVQPAASPPAHLRYGQELVGQARGSLFVLFVTPSTVTEAEVSIVMSIRAAGKTRIER